MQLVGRKSLIVLGAIAVATASCSDPTRVEATPGNELPAAFTAAISKGPEVFVLDHIEQQTSDPIVLFDHVCSGIRYSNLVRDSITIWPNGDARRTIDFISQTNGVTREENHMAYAGQWSRFIGTDTYYFSDGPSISLALAPMSPTIGDPYELVLRVRDGATLTDLQSLGGSCPGSANDARQSEASYTLR